MGIVQLRLIIFLSLIALNAHANKLSLGVGGYSLSADVGSEKTNLSNLGAYKFQYHSKLLENFELVLGYAILVENIFTGDKAFGPNMGLNYFPMGSQTLSNITLSDFSISSIKKLNPYVSLGFNQRQYQSINSSYSGFSIGGGVETGWTKNLLFYLDLQYASLDGPNEGSATEISSVIGIGYDY